MESLAKVLISLYRQSPHHETWVVACLEGMWRGLMGERIARICRPVEMRSGQLVVTVLNPAWHPVLSRMAPELLERIRSATGNEVRRLVLRLETGSAGERPPQSRES
jgi:predicted nucleic acid-binding Zn ribbon protein